MTGVVGWFAERGDVPLAPPPKLREHTPLTDDALAPGGFPVETIRGVTFVLEYCDSRGWASLRTVRCLAIDPTHPARVNAFCRVCQEERRFRIDRIISIADLRTGRILSGSEQIALLAPYLPDADADPDVAALAHLQDATRDGVIPLLQIAMPNGRLSATARVAVLNYVKSEARALGCAVPPHAYIELWIDNFAPTQDMVTTSVTNLLTDKERFARLLPSLLKVARSHESFPEHEESIRDLIQRVRLHFRDKVLRWPRDLRA